MSRFRPRSKKQQDPFDGLPKDLMEVAKLLGDRRQLQRAEKDLRVRCPYCTEESSAKPVMGVGNISHRRYCFRCDHCSTPFIGELGTADCSERMLDMFRLAADHGWQQGATLPSALQGKLGDDEKRKAGDYIFGGGLINDAEFWRALARGLGNPPDAIMTWSGVELSVPYATYLYLGCVVMTRLDLDQDSFFDAVLNKRLEAWLAAAFERRARLQ